jgi:hypothetical protein
MSFSCECYVLSGRGLCDELISRPEECGVSECDCDSSIMRRPWPARGCCAMGEKKTNLARVPIKFCFVCVCGFRLFFGLLVGTYTEGI